MLKGFVPWLQAYLCVPEAVNPSDNKGREFFGLTGVGQLLLCLEVALDAVQIFSSCLCTVKPACKACHQTTGPELPKPFLVNWMAMLVNLICHKVDCAVKIVLNLLNRRNVQVVEHKLAIAGQMDI